MFRPMVLTEKNDKTGALVKVGILKEILESNSEYLASENVIALYGGWGSGKSSVVESLTNKESENKLNDSIKTLVFEAWKYEKDENLSLSLFEVLMDFKDEEQELMESLKKWGKRELRTLFGATKGLVKGASFSLGIPTVGSVGINVGKIMEEIEKIDDDYSMTSNYSSKKEVKDKYKNLIKELKGKSEKLIVFVDDLDRCENENILDLITSLKHIFSEAEDIIFVVAIDKVAVTQALKVKYGENSEKAEEYLEKVFPITLSLPKKVDLEIYFEEFIKLGYEIVDEFYEKYNITTPRKVNKIINKMRMITQFSKYYKTSNEKNNYLRYLGIVLILEESAPEHLNVFLKKIKNPGLKNVTNRTIGNLDGINPFLFDIASHDDLQKSQMKSAKGKANKIQIEIEKNPLYKWGRSKLEIPKILDCINDINKYI